MEKSGSCRLILMFLRRKNEIYQFIIALPCVCVNRFFCMESEREKRAPVVETDTFPSFLSYVIIFEKNR